MPAVSEEPLQTRKLVAVQCNPRSGTGQGRDRLMELVAS